MSEGVQASRQHKSALSWKYLPVFALLSVLVGLVIATTEALTLKMGLLAIGLPVTLVLLLFYRIAFPLFTLVLLGTFDFTGYQPLVSDPVNIFLADGIIILATVALLGSIAKEELLKNLDTTLSRLLFFNLMYGIVALSIGLLVGHSLNDVIGDFRRFFFYPFVTVLATFAYFSRPVNPRRLSILFSLALVIIAGAAVGRTLLGRSWSATQFEAAADFRAMGYFTGVILLMGIGVFYGHSLMSDRRRRWLLLLGVLVLMGVTLLSGYRLLWILTLIIPLFVSFASSHRLQRIKRSLWTIFLTLLLILVATAVIQRTSPELFDLFVDKISELVFEFRFEENTRYYAWRTALEMFADSPLVGVGIGDRFTYWALSSGGQLFLKSSTTHNVLLSLLYQSGLIGAGFFIAIHSWVIWQVLRRLPVHESEARGPIVGMFAGYLGALAMGMLQPAFESAGSTVAFYLWIGMMLKLVNYYSRYGSIGKNSRLVEDWAANE